jgi:integral membrane protein
VSGAEGALLRYRVMAYIVGVGLLVLTLVGMPLQFAAGRPQVVQVVGPIHGMLYIVYLVSVLDLWRRARLTFWQLVGMVAAGFLPFLAFFVEHHMTRRVRAAWRGTTDASAARSAPGS